MDLNAGQSLPLANGEPVRLKTCSLPSLSCVLALLVLAACGADDTTPLGDDAFEDDAFEDDALAEGEGAELDESVACQQSLLGPVDPTALIDDLEDRNAALPLTGGRNGMWWLVSDASGGSIEPPDNQAPLPEPVLGGRCGSQYALRITGQGFSDWGAVLSLTFRFEAAPVGVDLSEFSGLRFFAKVGEQNTSAIQFGLQDESTHPAGGVCDPEGGASDRACFNRYGTELAPIGTQWQLYEIPFARLSQSPFFGLRTEGIDPTRVFAAEWAVEAGTVFDFWVDDVWLYR